MSRFDPKKPLPWQWVLLAFLSFAAFLLSIFTTLVYFQVLRMPRDAREACYRVFEFAVGIWLIGGLCLFWWGRNRFRGEKFQNASVQQPANISRGAFLVVGPLLLLVGLLVVINAIQSRPLNLRICFRGIILFTAGSIATLNGAKRQSRNPPPSGEL